MPCSCKRLMLSMSHLLSTSGTSAGKPATPSSPRQSALARRSLAPPVQTKLTSHLPPAAEIHIAAQTRGEIHTEKLHFSNSSDGYSLHLEVLTPSPSKQPLRTVVMQHHPPPLCVLWHMANHRCPSRPRQSLHVAPATGLTHHPHHPPRQQHRPRLLARRPSCTRPTHAAKAIPLYFVGALWRQGPASHCVNHPVPTDHPAAVQHALKVLERPPAIVSVVTAVGSAWLCGYRARLFSSVPHTTCVTP